MLIIGLLRESELALQALATGIKFEFGGGNGGDSVVTAKEFQGTISFSGLPTTQTVAQFFSLQGTPFNSGPPLVCFFLWQKNSLKADWKLSCTSRGN